MALRIDASWYFSEEKDDPSKRSSLNDICLPIGAHARDDWIMMMMMMMMTMMIPMMASGGGDDGDPWFTEFDRVPDFDLLSEPGGPWGKRAGAIVYRVILFGFVDHWFLGLLKMFELGVMLDGLEIVMLWF